MVVLTYQPEKVKYSSTNEAEFPENNVTEKTDGPKTAYIDKMCKFTEEDAEEEKCDMFFICQDGEVAAHRLVISNVSKFIMAMQDDQPPWYPVYITVPDLPKEIVQTLVQLAYTGQMNIPPSITSDDLLDAMQTLGWVHTDCLTATYTDSMSSMIDDETGSAVSSKTAESLETVLKMSFPVTKKRDAEESDEEDMMEMDLPDVPISDEEVTESSGKNNKSSASKGSNCGRRSKRSNKANTTKEEVSSSNKASPKQQLKSIASNKKTPSTSPTKDSRRRGGRKANVTEETAAEPEPSASVKKDVAEASSSLVASPEAVRSRTRTIRKPKKFDDLIVLTPTKRKDSPTKSPLKGVGKNVKDSEAEKESPSSAKASKIENAHANKTPNRAETGKVILPAPSNANGKQRRSTSSDGKETPRNSLITSYFNKKSPRQSECTSEEQSAEGPSSNDCGREIEVKNTNNFSSVVDVAQESLKQEQVDVNSEIKHTSDKIDTAASTVRRRARSTASSKSDKEVQEETKDSSEGTSKVAPRRKRNFQESQDTDTQIPDSTNPSRRGRKASTFSNTSNKDSLTDGDVDMSTALDSPRKKRNRNELTNPV